MPPRMKIVVAGASGFVGRHAVRALAEHGHDVDAIFHGDASFPNFAREVGVRATKHDLSSDDGRWNQEACVYLAGNSKHIWSVDHPLEDLQANAVALARFLRGFSGRLVYLSSAAVYEGLAGMVAPNRGTNPTMPYAISKLASERYVHHFARSGAIESFVILRLYYAFGPGERTGRLFSNLCRKVVLEGQQTFRVAGDGHSLVDPLYVTDVVSALEKALDRPETSGTYDLCGGQPTEVSKIVQDVASLGGREVTLEVDAERREVPVRFWSDPAPVRESLNLKPPLSLAQGVEEYMSWLRGRGDTGDAGTGKS